MVIWVFLTVAAWRINWAGVICASPGFGRLCPRVPREMSWTIEDPSELVSAMVSKVSLRCTFGRMPADVEVRLHG